MFSISILSECGTLFPIEKCSSKQLANLIVPNHDIAKEDKTILIQQ